MSLYEEAMKYATIALMAALFGAIAGWHIQGWKMGAEIAGAEKIHAEYVAEAERGAREAESSARIQESLWRKKHEELQAYAQSKIDSASIDATASRAAFERVQQLYAKSAAESRACGNTITAQLSAATTARADMSAYVLETLGNAALGYAREADARGIAGSACEMAYDSIKASPG